MTFGAPLLICIFGRYLMQKTALLQRNTNKKSLLHVDSGRLDLIFWRLGLIYIYLKH
jgi:hypothetical protein